MADWRDDVAFLSFRCRRSRVSVSRRARKHGERQLSKLETSELTRRLASSATTSDDGDVLFTQFCEALADAGLPVWRVSVSMPALDPMASTVSMTWTSDAGVVLSVTAHGAENGPVFQQSPIYLLLQENRIFGRWRLGELQPSDGLPLLQELRASGGTDYVLHMVAFAPGTALRGMALSFVTREASGFSDDHLAEFVDLLPVAGTHVLGGQIRRGAGRTIWAAILLTNLRGFTALADREDPTEVVGWLNDHFDAVGEPIAASGGEILKFMGDGFLAVFPVAAPDIRPCNDCESALQAAIEARMANRRLNETRRSRNLPPLEVDIVLHFGKVVYGNVGTDRRLDFTVIGRAVNEASRIEKLCGDLDRSILISDSFASRCKHALDAVGSVSLRGLEHTQRVWTLPDGNEPPPHSTA